ILRYSRNATMTRLLKTGHANAQDSMPQETLQNTRAAVPAWETVPLLLLMRSLLLSFQTQVFAVELPSLIKIMAAWDFKIINLKQCQHLFAARICFKV